MVAIAANKSFMRLKVANNAFDLMKSDKIIWSHDQKNFWSPDSQSF